MPKLRIENVIQEVADLGWKLVSKEYKNLDSELELLCPEQHIVLTSFKKWRTKHECPTCAHDSNKLECSKDFKIIPKTKGVKRILAIDDATEITGWAIYDGLKLIAYGKQVVSGMDPIKRISGMRTWLLNVITSWQPDFIGIEDIQLQKFYNPKTGQMDAAVTTYKVLAQLQGVLLVTIDEQKVDYTVVHSATWKSFCGINQKNRSDQKRAAQVKVKGWHNENVTQDEADAICIGKYLTEKYLRNFEIIDFGGLV